MYFKGPTQMFWVAMLTASVGLVALATALPSDMVPTSTEVPKYGIRSDLSTPDVEVYERLDGNRGYSAPDGPRPQQAPGFHQTSEYMLGSVTVSIILPESNGKIDKESENWRSWEKWLVKDEIRDGVLWWFDKAHDYGMYFPKVTLVYTHLDNPVETSYEPIRRCSYTCDTGENLWIDEIMVKLGFSTFPDYQDKVRHYDNHLRTTYGTDWAFTIFVVDSSNDKDEEFADGKSGYGYSGGPFLVMTYGNNGWGILWMNRVTAHEIGHIFYALDEYAESGCTTWERGGYLGRTNDNCENGGPGRKNVMLKNTLTGASPRIETREQIGWRDTDGDGIADIMDTFPETTLNPYSPDPTPDYTPTFTGNAVVVPLPEENPDSWVSTSINKISYVAFNIDGGPYMYPAYAADGAWGGANEDFIFTTPMLTPGKHTICARATNSVGNTGSSSCDTLNIDSPPRADAGGPYTAVEGMTVTFDGSGSTDDIGIVSYDWDFGDGTPHGSGVSPTHEYGDNGVYTVTLTVTDTAGQTSVHQTTVTVQNVAPTVTAGPAQTIDEGDTISTTSAFMDKGWLDTHTATINWGEGTIDTGIVTEENVKPDATGTVAGSHTYGDNGAFTVTVTVCDDDGACTADTLKVTVRNVAPIMAPLLPVLAIDEGQTATFSVTATDPGSDDLTFEWSWDYRAVCDSTTTYLNDPLYNPDPLPSPTVNPRSVSETRSCQYGDNGDFAVWLTVRDDDGSATTAGGMVNVRNVAPTVNALSSLVIHEGEIATFTVHATDPGSDDLTIDWSWEGRGACDSSTVYLNGILGPDPFPSPSVNPRSVSETRNCQYGDNGDFLILVKVADDDGSATTLGGKLTVSNKDPNIDPTVRAYVKVDVTLRASGEKWHTVDLILYEAGTVAGGDSIKRYPGDPDDQSVTVGSVEMDILACSSSADVLYTPLDDEINGQITGATPVWIILTYEDGTEIWLNHTFNVNHPATWTWTISDFCPYISAAGLPIYFEATASDVGSDDLTFTWSWDDATPDTSTTYFNNGASADPFPSPDVNPIIETNTVTHTYTSSGTYNITLKVTDDDTGEATRIITLTI